MAAVIDGLTEDERATLLAESEERKLPAGVAVVRAGDDPDGLYLLVEGSVRVLDAVGGSEVVLAHLVAGEVFGEMSALEGRRRSQTIMTDTPCVVRRITPAVLDRFTERHPRGAARFFRALLVGTSHRMRNTNRMVREKNEELQKLLDRTALDKDFLGLLVHDLRSPLSVAATGIVQLVDRQAKFGEITDRQLRVLKRVSRAHTFMRHLLEEILEVGRSEQGVRRADDATPGELPLIAVPQCLARLDGVDLDEADVQDLDRVAAALAQHEIHIEAPEPHRSAALKTDRTRVVQVLINLIGNAFKYAPGWLRVAVEVKDGKLRFTVQDRGPGIPKGFEKKIFDRYAQVDSKNEGVGRGFGFGLAGARALVQSLGGDIWVESGGEGKGSTFFFELPTHIEARQA